MEELIRELLEEVKGLRRDIQTANLPKPYENIDGLTARMRGDGSATTRTKDYEFVTTPEPKRLAPDSSGIQAHEEGHSLMGENWRKVMYADVGTRHHAPGTTILAARQEFADSGRTDAEAADRVMADDSDEVVPFERTE